MGKVKREYIWMPSGSLHWPRSARRMYGALAQFRPRGRAEVTASIWELAAEANLAARTVQLGLQQLEAIGAIERIRDGEKRIIKVLCYKDDGRRGVYPPVPEPVLTDAEKALADRPRPVGGWY